MKGNLLRTIPDELLAIIFSYSTGYELTMLSFTSRFMYSYFKDDSESFSYFRRKNRMKATTYFEKNICKLIRKPSKDYQLSERCSFKIKYVFTLKANSQIRLLTISADGICKVYNLFDSSGSILTENIYEDFLSLIDRENFSKKKQELVSPDKNYIYKLKLEKEKGNEGFSLYDNTVSLDGVEKEKAKEPIYSVKTLRKNSSQSSLTSLSSSLTSQCSLPQENEVFLNSKKPIRKKHRNKTNKKSLQTQSRNSNLPSELNILASFSSNETTFGLLQTKTHIAAFSLLVTGFVQSSLSLLRLPLWALKEIQSSIVCFTYNSPMLSCLNPTSEVKSSCFKKAVLVTCHANHKIVIWNYSPEKLAIEFVMDINVKASIENCVLNLSENSLVVCCKDKIASYSLANGKCINTRSFTALPVKVRQESTSIRVQEMMHIKYPKFNIFVVLFARGSIKIFSENLILLFEENQETTNEIKAFSYQKDTVLNLLKLTWSASRGVVRYKEYLFQQAPGVQPLQLLKIPKIKIFVKLSAQIRAFNTSVKLLDMDNFFVYCVSDMNDIKICRFNNTETQLIRTIKGKRLFKHSISFLSARMPNLLIIVQEDNSVSCISFNQFFIRNKRNQHEHKTQPNSGKKVRSRQRFRQRSTLSPVQVMRSGDYSKMTREFGLGEDIDFMVDLFYS